MSADPAPLSHMSVDDRANEEALARRHDPVVEFAGGRCPDGGTCHHGCHAPNAAGDGTDPRTCWRVATCEPLTGTYPDGWPADVLERHVRGVTAHGSVEDAIVGPARRTGDELDPVAAEKLIAARGALAEAEANAFGPEPEPHEVEVGDGIGLPDGKARHLLELNGFNAVRAEALGAVSKVLSIPLEAVEAAIAFNKTAVARLRVDPHPSAAAALAVSERQGAFLEAFRRFRRDLSELEERLERRDRITAR